MDTYHYWSSIVTDAKAFYCSLRWIRADLVWVETAYCPNNTGAWLLMGTVENVWNVLTGFVIKKKKKVGWSKSSKKKDHLASFLGTKWIISSFRRGPLFVWQWQNISLQTISPPKPFFFLPKILETMSSVQMRTNNLQLLSKLWFS